MKVFPLLFTALAALAAGLYLGGHPALLPADLRERFVDRDVALQAEALDVVEKNYYKPVDTGKLGTGGVKSIVRGLGDRFSAYLDPRHTGLFQKRGTSGEYYGVGLSVGPHPRGLRVAAVFPGSPAAHAGIERGELVIGVDGRPIRHRSLEEAVHRIKGKPDTTVRLTLVSASGKRRTYRLRRARIDLPLAAGQLVRNQGKKLGVVRLVEFSRGARTDVARAIKEVRRRGAEGLVLDLRGNPGGFVREAVAVASLFLRGGAVVSTKGRARPLQVYRAGNKPLADKIPAVVLVDRFSASAAEIVTGALKDRHRATVVGERTFGKGEFQNLFPLSNGGAIDLTVGRYYTPRGRNLDRKGVAPDRKAVDGSKTDRDEALGVALDELSRKLAKEVKGKSRL